MPVTTTEQSEEEEIPKISLQEMMDDLQLSDEEMSWTQLFVTHFVVLENKIYDTLFIYHVHILKQLSSSSWIIVNDITISIYIQS